MPDGAVYFRSFERGDFPFVLEQDDPVWSTTNNDDPTKVWELTDEQAASGVYSIRSPALVNDALTPGVATATLQLPDYGIGAIHYSLLGSVLMPIDRYELYVDGVQRDSQVETMTAFEERVVQVGPGPHTVDFVYNYNPVPLTNPNAFPPPEARPNHLEAVFIDDVYFVPISILPEVNGTTSPTAASSPMVSDGTGSPPSSPVDTSVGTASPTTSDGTASPTVSVGSVSPTINDGTASPTVSDGTASPTASVSPTSSPGSTESSTESPTATCVELSNNPDDFEDGTFPLPPWRTAGDGVWALTDEKAYSGTNSIRSPILESEDVTSKLVSNTTLQICDDFLGGVMRLQAYASVQPPRDLFIIYVDGVAAAQLVDVNEWTPVALGLEPGSHRIDFSYQFNPFDVESLPPSPPTREGKFGCN